MECSQATCELGIREETFSAYECIHTHNSIARIPKVLNIIVRHHTEILEKCVKFIVDVIIDAL